MFGAAAARGGRPIRARRPGNDGHVPAPAVPSVIRMNDPRVTARNGSALAAKAAELQGRAMS